MIDDSEADVAETVRLSYSPSTVDPETSSFTGFLKKKHGGPASVGEEWDELAGVGCGRTRGVAFVVEAVIGGDELSTATDIELVANETEETASDR